LFVCPASAYNMCACIIYQQIALWSLQYNGRQVMACNDETHVEHCKQGILHVHF